MIEPNREFKVTLVNGNPIDLIESHKPIYGQLLMGLTVGIIGLLILCLFKTRAK